MKLISQYLVKNKIAYYLDMDSALSSIDFLYRYKYEINNTKLWSTPTVYIKKSVIDEIKEKMIINKDEENYLTAKVLNDICNEFNLVLGLNKTIKEIDFYLNLSIISRDNLGKFLVINNLAFNLENNILATIPINKPNIQKILRNIPNYDIIKDNYDIQSLIHIIFQLSLLANSIKEIDVITTRIILEKKNAYINFIKILVK